MKQIFSTFRFAMLVAAAAVSFTACKKTEGGELGGLPKPDFAVIPSASNPNNLTLVNTSSTSQPVWRVGNSTSLLRGDSAKVSFDVRGTYNITLFALGHGGIDSITKQVVIAQDDVTACQRNVKGVIAGCGATGKTWKLNPDAGAYKVGPGPGNGSWWSSGAGDVTGRSCEFNDEYKFTYSTGAFVYDNKGDFYGDGYLGNNSNACQPTGNYTAAQAPWGSGTFTFTFTEGTGNAGLGQLTVIGLGAHIGLQKVRNGGEVTSGPASAITYDILSVQKNFDGNGHDKITLGTNIGGDGWWTFALRSY